MATYSEYFDCMYGMYKLPAMCVAIVHTTEFQRLRDIAAMGPTQWMLPSATHSMFEHSVGCAILAHMWLSSLRGRFPALVEKRDVNIITVACLLRNIGCMPWERVYAEFMHEEGRLYTMEHSSVKVVSKILGSSKFRNHFSHADVVLIEELILGDVTKAPPDWVWTGSDKKFMFQFVNANTGLDVPFLDRTMRSARRLGVGCNNALQTVSNMIAKSWVEDWSTLLKVSSNDFRELHSLEESIDQFSALNYKLAAISVMAIDAWRHVSIMYLAQTDINTRLQMTDYTLRTGLKFAFFFIDLVNQNLPLLTAEHYFTTPEQVRQHMRAAPLKERQVYHMSTINSTSKKTYILRVFQLAFNSLSEDIPKLD